MVSNSLPWQTECHQKPAIALNLTARSCGCDASALGKLLMIDSRSKGNCGSGGRVVAGRGMCRSSSSSNSSNSVSSGNSTAVAVAEAVAVVVVVVVVAVAVAVAVAVTAAA